MNFFKNTIIFIVFFVQSLLPLYASQPESLPNKAKIDFSQGLIEQISGKPLISKRKPVDALVKDVDGKKILRLNGKRSDTCYLPYSPGLSSPAGVIVDVTFRIPKSAAKLSFYIVQNGHNWGVLYDKGLLRGMVLLDNKWRMITPRKPLATDSWHRIRFVYSAADRRLQLFENGNEVAVNDLASLNLKNYSLRATKQKIAFGWNSAGWNTKPMHGDILKFALKIPDSTYIRKKPINMEKKGKNLDPSPIRHPRIHTMKGKTPQYNVLDSFTDLAKWKIEYDPNILEAYLFRGEVEKAFGNSNMKLAFKPVPSAKSIGTLIVQPVKPIIVNQSFDTFAVWIYSEIRTKKRTGINIRADFVDATKRKISIPIKILDIGNDYREGWNYINFRLKSPVASPSIFKGFVLSNITTEDILYIDSPGVYIREKSKNNSTARIPTWQEIGAPTRLETILPELKNNQKFTNTLVKTNDGYIFSYEGNDEKISYIYRPATGLLTDITVKTANGKFFPARDGGWVLAGKHTKISKKTKAGNLSNDGDSLKTYFDSGNNNFAVAISGIKRKLKSIKIENNKLKTCWRWYGNGWDFESRLDFSIRQKSLIIDAECTSNKIVQFSLGAVSGLENPIMTQVPYLTLWGHYTARPGKNRRDVNPRILYDRGHFFSAFMDWYNSEASELFSDVDTFKLSDGQACIINGGSAYYPKSDGKRNFPRERIFLTASKFFDETLPVVANPPNPSNEITQDMVWATTLYFILLFNFTYILLTLLMCIHRLLTIKKG